MSLDIEFTTDQTVRPVFVHGDHRVQDRHRATVVGAAEEDDLALPVLLGRWAGPGQPQRSGVDSGGVTLPVGLNEFLRMRQHRRKPSIVTPVPYLGLPQMIEALDFSLEAGFAGRSKDWNNSQGQTQIDDAAQPTGQIVRALKTRVVVELDIVREAKDTPMLGQAVQYVGSSEGSLWPRHSQTAVKGDAVKHFDRRPSFDGQAFDEIKLLQLDPALSQFWKVPTWWGRRLAPATPIGKQPMSTKDALDGAMTRQRGTLFELELAANGPGSKLSQRAVFFKPRAQSQDAFNQALRSPVARTWIATRTVLPVGTMQALALGAVEPFPDGLEADVEAPSDLTEGSATAQSGHETPPFSARFFSIIGPGCRQAAPKPIRATAPPFGGCARLAHARLRSAAEARRCPSLRPPNRSPFPVAQAFPISWRP